MHYLGSPLSLTLQRDYKMNKEIENLITKSAYRDIQIGMLNKEIEGLIITKDIVLEIIKELDENNMSKIKDAQIENPMETIPFKKDGEEDETDKSEKSWSELAEDNNNLPPGWSDPE